MICLRSSFRRLTALALPKFQPTCTFPYPFENDGDPAGFINSITDPTPLDPLGFKDNHYPDVCAGCATLGRIAGASVPGNPNEALGSLWYHDHHLDFTAQTVYKCMFGCDTLFDDVDNNNENDTTRAH